MKKKQDVLKSAGCNPATVSNSPTLRDRLLLPVLIFFWLIFSAMKCAFGFSVISAQSDQEYHDRLTPQYLSLKLVHRSGGSNLAKINISFSCLVKAGT